MAMVQRCFKIRSNLDTAVVEEEGRLTRIFCILGRPLPGDYHRRGSRRGPAEKDSTRSSLHAKDASESAARLLKVATRIKLERVAATFGV